MSRAFEMTRTIMEMTDSMKQAMAMFPRSEVSSKSADGRAIREVTRNGALSELVDDRVICEATRVFIADAAIPEEIVRLTGDFVADYQTKVPSPEIMTRTVFRGMPSPDELMEGDVIYFRRQGAFRHVTGWDRVVLLGKWDEFLITAARSYHQR